MHIARFIDLKNGIVCSTVTGTITVAEVRADMARLAAEPVYAPDMPGIIDMRNATAGLSGDELRQIAEVVKNSPKVVAHTRRALLVSTDLMFGLYRMFATFASDSSIEYQIFRDEKPALAWIEEVAERRRKLRS